MPQLFKLSFISAFVLGLFSLSVFAESSLTIEDARVRAPYPGQQMSAAYLNIINHSEFDTVLTSVNAPWAGAIEIHTHIMKEGKMRMRRLQELVIPAGETKQLEPGGLHLMLFRLQLPLAESLPLTLCFKNESCEQVTATLYRPQP